MPTQKSSIEHPNHVVPDEIAASFRTIREAELATRARQDKISKLARPNEEDRRLIAELSASVDQTGGVNVEKLQGLRDANTRRFDLIMDAVTRDVVPLEFHRDWELLRGPDILTPPLVHPPEPTDHTFWWATTEWSIPDGFSGDLRNDGLHFLGGVTCHDGDLHIQSFGAVALFELQAARIPHSDSNRWRSTPHVELFGALRGYTGSRDIFTGDLWSKCWMHRDQRLYQFGFGPDGPVKLKIGEAHEIETLIFEENAARSVSVGLRGFQWMPPVTITNINLANSLWARLEIRFDIQVEGAGTLVWADPQVLLRTFQWPLTLL